MPRARAQSNFVASHHPIAGVARVAAASILGLLVTAAFALSFGAAPRAGAQTSPAALHVVQNGGGSVTVQGPRQSPATCTEGFYPNTKCEYGTFLPGETVTLTANATAPAEFKGWSDDRCSSPTPTTCTLTLAEEQTVVALFSPLPVDVGTNGIADGTETVTITDGAGKRCKAVDLGLPGETCTFALLSDLTLVATGKEPRFNPGDCDVAQAGSDRSTCTATLLGRQQFNVGFNGQAPPDNAPPRVDVIFRVRKTGSGAGTIRGALDCGSRCSVRVPFRQRVSLVADAAAGSRFVRWIGGCGTDATCSLQASSTSVAAEFADVPAPRPEPRPDPRPVFGARIGKITTTGRGRRRAIRIAVLVNAPASARATLVKGRRQVVGRLFSVAPGPVRTLRLRVPARTRAGRYQLKLTIRDRAGSAPIRLARGVRLRR